MAYTNNPPSIALDRVQWDATGQENDPKARLLAHIRIGSLNLHLEAWAVTEDAEGLQHAEEASMRSDDFDALCNMMDCSFETIEIHGRDYVLIATPYGK